MIEDTPEEEEQKSQPKVSFQVEDENEKKLLRMKTDLKRKSAVPFKR
jgi:hypothetical protein